MGGADSRPVNRLARETSPYLRQHRHNPVDWYPWGEAAFTAARESGKPIFLSVGYSSCYWCHVMERECFENESIALEMNRRFVNVKVDREERPDVDQIYMQAVQVLTQHGGWPMSVFLTPDRIPFYGGTYFPPRDAHGRPGFPTLLRAIDDAWQHRRDELERSARQLVEVLRKLAQPARSKHAMNIDADRVAGWVGRSASDYEPAHGGFGDAPKFPRETLLELLLVHNHHRPDEALESKLRHTLDAMANGGIRDHLGGGFHRYSTDARWLVPHFEIMLYDNALLGWCYVEAYRQFEHLRYARVARGIFDFVLRSMTSPLGAFYTAFDAEVDAREGMTYLWTRQEVEQTLRSAGFKDTAIGEFVRAYGLDAGPNFADPHHGTGSPDRNILHLPHLSAPAPISRAEDPEAEHAPLREALLAVRDARKQPMLDTKILTSWNALMVRALACGGAVLQEPRYLRAAERAADFLLEHHRAADGGLFRTSRPDQVAQPAAPARPIVEARIAGTLDDYAYLAQACFALYKSAGDVRWRDAAASIVSAMRMKFAAEGGSSGAFFYTESGDNDLIVRQISGTDNPLPSANAIAALVLQDLGHGDEARRIIETFAHMLDRQAEGMSAMVLATDGYVRQFGGFEVAGSPADTQSGAQQPQSVHELAGGIVEGVSADWTGDTTLQLTLSIREGYHIMAATAGKPFVGTRLELPGITEARVAYPAGGAGAFSFVDPPPPLVYDGTIHLVVSFPDPASAKRARAAEIDFALTYQACDATACLPPVTRRLRLQNPG